MSNDPTPTTEEVTLTKTQKVMLFLHGTAKKAIKPVLIVGGSALAIMAVKDHFAIGQIEDYLADAQLELTDGEDEDDIIEGEVVED